MRAIKRHGSATGAGAWLRRAPVIAAALYLALVQILTAAHAASGEAQAPDHNSAACVFHIAADRMHGAAPTAPAEIVPPAAEYLPLALPAVVALIGEAATLPPSRGPPPSDR